MFEFLDVSDLISLSVISFVTGVVAILTTFKIKFRFTSRPEGLY